MARSPRKSAKSISLTGRLVRWWFRPRRLFVGSLVALALVVGTTFLNRFPPVDARPEYQASSQQIILTPAPHWIPPDLAQDALKRAGLDTQLSLLDNSLSERIAAAFYTHPWILDVQRVEKFFPARICVDLTYRQPVAIVKGVDGYYPIDRYACLLPGNDFRPSDIDRYPVVENVTSVPATGQGQPWGDPSVAGAARLAAIFMDSGEDEGSLWEELDLAAIIAPHDLYLPGEGADPEFAIRTSGGSVILWGRAPGTRHPGELAAEKKVGRLTDYHRDHGSLDDAPEPYMIDIRDWNSIIRTRLTRNARTRRVR